MFARPAGKRLRRTLVVTILAGVTLSLALIFHVVPIRSGSSSRTAHTPALNQPAKAGVPVRLKIPKINVDAPIEQVGLTSDGSMDTPKDPLDVASYSPGPRPGETGSAVIDGHFDRKGGSPGVFYNLNKLQNGDKLSVEDETGATITFVVRESRKYDPKADAAGVFRSGDGKVHLNLITCSGVWDTGQQSYSNRLVIFADKK